MSLEELGPEAAFDAEEPQEDMFGFDDAWRGGRTDDPAFEEDAASEPDELEDAADRGQRLMDGTWTRSLFRRAAQALHPDRASDPEQRKVKEELMQQSLAARERDDIMALLQLYSEHVADGDLVLAEQETSAACELMEEWLEQLRVEQAASVYARPLRMHVHNLL
ncbi:MAG: hypothetical protein GWO39_13015 [Gammaproteobacteria bacterium]|nr:hypothetical protein [Gammaproteobacteria bacterium]NIT64647.1 hypothetical protein [Gammaproteobacteria bacterium]NIV21620.1 hypothetical protein [Gammaproteobacteria bacterium]NIY33227.1 hypothetical protein [Gammaproteobacteria bacterium]